MPTHSDVKELFDRFGIHRDAIEERLKQDPADDAMRDALEDAEEAIEELQPLLGVDDDDLDKYDSQITELTDEEQELAAKLEA
jgi:hypothetical protein